jgi:hypothetical protein
VTMPARAHRNAIIFCGTMGLLRRRVVDEIGGWSETCITEDAEASLRIVGRGYKAAFDPEPQGSGLMPLSFDGLKKQRYRWALGGVQILRQHWRELVPFARHRLELSTGQRMHYLLGSLQWFGDVLAAGFTVMLMLTALGIAVNHRLPIRQLGGALVLVPLLFLCTGLMRAMWAIRTIEQCRWSEALRALRIWFALSWVVALACITGLARKSAVFLRTPKKKEGEASLIQALAASRVETALALAALTTAATMLWVTRTGPFLILASMLMFDAFIYLNAPWASAAAEGIQLTPLRQAYRRSPQSTGDRPPLTGSRALALSSAAGLAAAGAVAVALLGAAPTNPALPEPPALGGGGQSSPLPSPSPADTPSASATESPPATPATDGSPLSAPSPSGNPGPRVSPSARPAPSPRVTP